jgi:Mg2+ and Co2+ transporter CorA
MITESIQNWLNTLELNLEQRVLSGLCLQLAKSFDQQANTSTAAELRKTVLELKRSIGSANDAIDPLEKLLTR